MKDFNFTQKRLKQLIDYDKRTGIFTWKSTIGGRRTDGPAGTIWADGSIHIGVEGKVYAAHRLAWFYVIGEWPKNWIAHKNGDKGDNRLRNLKEKTQRKDLFDQDETILSDKKVRYSFDLSEENNMYVAVGTVDKGGDDVHKFVTEGKNKEELFSMVADTFITIAGIKVSWRNKLVDKLHAYK